MDLDVISHMFGHLAKLAYNKGSLHERLSERENICMQRWFNVCNGSSACNDVDAVASCSVAYACGAGPPLVLLFLSVAHIQKHSLVVGK
eukprot:scaffold247027_cov15-Tisochrysis_lutea.AAC.1